MSRCAPAGFCAVNNVAIGAPAGDTRLTVTLAAARQGEGHRRRLAGRNDRGALRAAFCTARAAPAASVPVAERAFELAIVHVYLSDGAAAASHVQSTAVPVPVPCATCDAG